MDLTMSDRFQWARLVAFVTGLINQELVVPDSDRRMILSIRHGHVAVLIHGSPEILLLAVDSNEDLLQVPNVAEAART
jgi:hypothetical protein